jgi:hypothetical protein
MKKNVKARDKKNESPVEAIRSPSSPEKLLQQLSLSFSCSARTSAKNSRAHLFSYQD